MANDNGRLEVAVFGFYRYGNFGDDLAAAIFCRRLKELGVGVRVYGLCEPYAVAFSLTVTETVEDLLDGVDMFLFGGGGVLVSNRRPSRLYLRFLATACLYLWGALSLDAHLP